MAERKPVDRWLTLSAEHFDIATAPDGRVVFRFHFPGNEIGLAEGIGLAVGLRPEQARRIAGLLQERATLAENESSRRS